MIRALHIYLVTFTLSACGVWSAGKDPHGRALIDKANAVLDAANQFTGARGSHPNDLLALVPDFIAALPDEPQLSYDATKGTLRFTYSPTLGTGQCICAAEIGAGRFDCHVCYM